MKWGSSTVVAVVACVLVACGQPPIKPAANHIGAADVSSPGSIPPPVQVTPLLPKPKAAARPETYSVVVNNVRVQELLFALARDARLQIDIDPNLAGSVTLNAIDQTLPQLLSRISRQADMRYELDGDTLIVMRDSPFLRAYKIDYLSAARNVQMKSNASTQFGVGAGSAGGQGTTGATTQVELVSHRGHLPQRRRRRSRARLIRKRPRSSPTARAAFSMCARPPSSTSACKSSWTRSWSERGARC